MNGIKNPSIMNIPPASLAIAAAQPPAMADHTTCALPLSGGASSSFGMADGDEPELYTASLGSQNRHRQLGQYLEGRRGRNGKRRKNGSGTTKAHLATPDGVNLAYTNKKTIARDIVIGGRLIRVWHPHAESNEEAMMSFKNLARYPDVYPYIAVMPDFHAGESSVNGTIIPSLETLYVNAIGGDIGCGMASLKLPLTHAGIAPHLEDIYREIYRRVPVGRRTRTAIAAHIEADPLFAAEIEVMNRANTRRAMQQMGTLGSGNHFVEIQQNDEGAINIMVHTGSRIVGQNIRNMGVQMGTQSQRPRGLVTLQADSDNGRIYMNHVSFALAYARANRREILRHAFEAFKRFVPQLGDAAFEQVAGEIIDVPHNYIAREHHFGRDVYVHRKGAVHVPAGSLGLIPGSMGASSYIVRGRGNAFSFDSSSHGAGRRMSRGEAFRRINRDAYREAMKGIISRDDDSIIDEAPQAYKDIDEIMGYQRDLVKEVERLHPLASIKG